jgi:hypothetical protein
MANCSKRRQSADQAIERPRLLLLFVKLGGMLWWVPRARCLAQMTTAAIMVDPGRMEIPADLFMLVPPRPSELAEMRL